MLEASINVDENSLRGIAIPVIESLSLTAHGVLGHFAQSTRNAQLLSFLLALDRVDRWAVDFDEDQAANTLDIQLFLQELHEFVESSLPVLHRVPEEFAELLAHLTTTRCMYLIRFVGQRNESFLDELASLIDRGAAASPSVAAIQRRFEAFSKARLLGEIFSGKRLTRITQIMGSYSHV